MNNKEKNISGALILAILFLAIIAVGLAILTITYPMLYGKAPLSPLDGIYTIEGTNDLDMRYTSPISIFIDVGSGVFFVILGIILTVLAIKNRKRIKNISNN